MAWYLNANGETHGPTDEDTVARWVREGRFTSGKVCRVGTDEWLPLTSHLPFAVALRDAAPPPPPPGPTTSPVGTPVAQATSTRDTQGLAILLAPVVATVLMVVATEVFGLALADFAVTVIGVSTIILTAAMITSEASRLQMGKLPVENGQCGNSPAAWLVVSLAFWVIAFPLFLRKRRWYGMPSKGALGLLVGLLFMGTWWFAGYIIELQLEAGFNPF